MTHFDPHIHAALVNAIYSMAAENHDFRLRSRVCAQKIAARIVARYEDQIDVDGDEVTFIKSDLETVLCDLRSDAPHLFE
jgi:hypothetical protein